MSRGLLFEDPDFPAIDSSLYFSKRPDRYIEWRRPMVRKYFFKYATHKLLSSISNLFCLTKANIGS